MTTRHDLMYGDVKLFSGTSNRGLSQGISNYLHIPLCPVTIKEFKNENLFVQLGCSVRGQDCYAIQTTAAPVHRNLMEFLMLIQALRLDSAARITAVIPYLCYARSDKKDQPRIPITARLVTDMLEVAGADRYMCVDLHAGQIQGFFSIPGDALTAYHMMVDNLKSMLSSMKDPVVVSTDLGFAKRARNFAERLGTPLAFIEKRRTGNNDGSEALSIIGEVKGHDVILADDEIDTGGSMRNAIDLVDKLGAREIYVNFVHPVFSANAAERMASTRVSRFITTDTIAIPDEKAALFGDRLQVLSMANLLGEVIHRANHGISVGSLFNE